MNSAAVIASIALISFTYATASAIDQLPSVELRLERFLPINGLQDPSGLTWHDGQLYAVSDKVDDTIYSLTPSSDSAEAKPYLHVQVDGGSGPLDLEGIAVDHGDWLLLSELEKAVLRVNATGDIVSQTQLTDDAPRKLFVERGAGPEGIAVLSDGRMVVAAERQPCGLLVFGESGGQFVLDENSGYPKQGDRPQDATDLWTEDNELWCLSRNAEAVVRLKEVNGQWQVVGRLAFGHLGDSIAYADETYGTAEGLAVSDQCVFVVLDNNGLERRSVKGDRRPLLLIFKRPALKQPSDESTTPSP